MSIHADQKYCTNPECDKQNPQPIDDFNKNRNLPDGHMNHCKSCRKKYGILYRATQAYKDSQRRYRQSESGRKSDHEGSRRYRQTEHGRETSRLNAIRHRETEKYKKYKNEYWQKYKNVSGNKNKIKARAAISTAVKLKKLPHISTLTCTFCPSQAQNYHHHSYKKRYWLDVIPVCEFCHKRLHPQ